MFKPNSWAIVELPKGGHKLVRFNNRLDSPWNINSGIISIKEDTKFYYIEGYSGSLYKCEKSKELKGSEYVNQVMKVLPAFADRVMYVPINLLLTKYKKSSA